MAYNRDQLNTIRKFIIIPNWESISLETTYSDRKVRYLSVIEKLSSGHVYETYFVANRELAADQVVQMAIKNVAVRQSWPWSITDGHLGESTLRALVEVARSRLGAEKFQELYVKLKIDERASKASSARQSAKDKRHVKRAQTFTIPGQKEIVRRTALLLINQALEQVGVPFRLSGSVTAFGPSVYFQVKPTVDRDNLFTKLFKSRDTAAEVEDLSGEKLYEAISECGFDTDNLMKLMAADAGSEHCRQFSVVFGDQIVAGILDRDEIVRRAAKLKHQSKKADTDE